MPRSSSGLSGGDVRFDRYKSLCNRRATAVNYARKLLDPIAAVIARNGRKPDSLTELVRWLNDIGFPATQGGGWHYETLSYYLNLGSFFRLGRKGRTSKNDQLSVMEMLEEFRHGFQTVYGEERVALEERAAVSLLRDGEAIEKTLRELTGPMNARDLFGSTQP